MIEIALASDDELGEGPWWSVEDQALWRVDIRRQLVLRWDPAAGEQRRWKLPQQVGFFVPTTTSGCGVAGLRDGLYVLDLESGECERLCLVEADVPRTRLNDGKCDRQGRLWGGSMDDELTDKIGSLYRLGLDGSLDVAIEGVIISNGLGWSPDDRTMYYTDSGVRTVWSLDFDPETGELGERRVFTTDGDGYSSDGLTVDSEGGVWTAKWDASRIVRYTPDGQTDRVVELPTRRPTSLCFGGPDLEQLYVTTATWDLDERERREPAAGSVLVLEPGVRGLPETPFRGVLVSETA